LAFDLFKDSIIAKEKKEDSALLLSDGQEAGQNNLNILSVNQLF
jgi:hypothetical protein